MSNPIGWCEQTLNPLVGCTKVGLACDHCYAAHMAYRLACMDLRGYNTGVVQGIDGHGRWTGKVAFIESELQKPLKRRKPTTYFMVSMGDVFHENVTDEWRDKIFATMAMCPQHAFIVLTKRIMNAREYLRLARGYPNVQLLVSIWDQASADAAIPVLLDTPAVVRGVSIEPMLGPIDFSVESKNCAMCCPNCVPRLDRVILGGENGPGARPMHPDWVRSVRDQCVDAGVPFWFKSWGDGMHNAIIDIWCAARRAGWDENAKHGGHMLDGREWRQAPGR